MDICVIGLGYIGLPNAVMLANHGHNVIGYDIDEKLVSRVNSGKTSIKEAGFKDHLVKAIDSGRLKAVSEMPKADAFIICVPTPYSPHNNEETLKYVNIAARAAAKVLEKGNLVILESTVPPGTTHDVLGPIFKEAGLEPGTDFYLAYCPERLLPGKLLYEIVNNDRIIGGFDEASAQKAKELYSSFVKGEMFLTSTTTAEFVKIVENTYRAVNIGLANELALLAEYLGIDINEAISLSNRHPRVTIYNPGPGVGGHCIPVDPWFLVEMEGTDAKVIRSSLERNRDMPIHVVEMLEDALKSAGKASGAKIAIMGVAYKPDVNDARESPAEAIADLLGEKGYPFTAVDPIVDVFKYPLKTDVYSALEGADAIVLVTDHKAFKQLDMGRIKGAMNDRPVIIDTRNMFTDTDGFILRKVGNGAK